jgi:hypothetical protein
VVRFLTVIAVPVLFAVAIRAADEKPVDYQKMATDAKWLLPEDEGFLRCLAHELSDYQLEVIRRKGYRWDATLRVVADKKEIYSWPAHLGTVFMEQEGVLYHADFSPIATGCSLVAFDLKAGKKLWDAPLKGIGPTSHSKYRNAVRLESVDVNVVAVYGKESHGRYVEIVDRKTGKTVGHKVFADGK